MHAYEDQLREVVEATAITSRTTYAWFGKGSPTLTRAVRTALTAKAARSYLLHIMQGGLYNDFYVRGYPVTRRWDRTASGSERAPFLAALSSANTGTGFWEGGWDVVRHVDGNLVVRRDGLELWVRPDDCLLRDATIPPPGSATSLRMPKEFLGASPGYYVASGDQAFQVDGRSALLRLYWNLTVHGAVPFVRSATGALNGNVPYRLKVLQDPRSFTRCDAGVLYVCQRDCLAAAPAIRHIHKDVARYLKPSTPALTKRLWPGVGFAEDPGADESFGQHRCGLLADGLIRAYEEGAASVDARFAVVAEHFAANGIRLDEPYLNPGSVANPAVKLAGET